MNEKARDLILAWHDIYMALNDCIESARVVLDQSDRGTLLPDRVREMRGELLAVQERLPKLADLLEELAGVEAWPMSFKDVAAEGAPDEEAAADEEEAAEEAAEGSEPPATAEGDYDATGATPGAAEEVEEETVVDEEAAAEEGAAEADATGTP